MKFRKSLIILPILLIAALVLVPVLDKKRQSTLREDEKHFKVENPEKVSKIFMTKRSGPNITLEKQPDGNWMVNGKFNAAPEKMALFFETLTGIEARNPVGEAAHNNVVEQMISGSVKVEIYERKKKPSLVYYVGGNTADERGTFMWKENARTVYVVHIPGFIGYLNSRYALAEQDWRTRNIFNAPIQDLKSVTVIYTAAPEASFKAEKTGEEVSITALNNASAPSGKPLNKLFLKQYLAQFGNLHHEGFNRGVSPGYLDSLNKATPFCTITTELQNGQTSRLRMYRKPVTKETKSQYDADGRELLFDLDRYFGLINDDLELVTLQQFVFKNVLLPYEVFFGEGEVAKE